MTDLVSEFDVKAKKKIFAAYLCLQIYMLIVRLLRVALYDSIDSLNLIFDHYNIIYYGLNYDNGFIIRGFAGELFGNIFLNMGTNLFFNAQIFKTIYVIIFFVILTCLLFRYSNKDNYTQCVAFIMFCRPYYLCNASAYLLKTDIYWYISIVPIVILLWHNKTKHFNIRMIIVVLLSLLAMLFHQAFIFVFAPLVCAILIDKNEKIWFLIYGIILCCSFMIQISFFQGDYEVICNQAMMNFKAVDLWQWVTDPEVQLFTNEGELFSLYYEYEDSRLLQMFDSEELQEAYIERHIPMCVYGIVLSVFSIVFTFKVLLKYVILHLEGKFRKILSFCVFFLPFVALSVFTIDIDRWFFMTLTSLNIFALYVMTKYNIVIKTRLHKVFYVYIILQVVMYPILVLTYHI